MSEAPNILASARHSMRIGAVPESLGAVKALSLTIPRQQGLFIILYTLTVECQGDAAD